MKILPGDHMAHSIIHLYVHFNTYTPPCIEIILSIFECSCGYDPSIEMGIVSEVSSHPQLMMSNI